MSKSTKRLLLVMIIGLVAILLLAFYVNNFPSSPKSAKSETAQKDTFDPLAYCHTDQFRPGLDRSEAWLVCETLLKAGKIRQPDDEIAVITDIKGEYFINTIEYRRKINRPPGYFVRYRIVGKDKGPVKSLAAALVNAMIMSPPL